MTKIKVEKISDYTAIQNATLQDVKLSFKARGLLAYMLSLPDDWDYSVAGLQTASKADGRDSISKALKELETLGYMKRHKKFKERGRFDGYEYVVYERPYTVLPNTEKPQTDRPYTALPNTEKPQQQKKYITNKATTKEILNKEDDDIATSNSVAPIISSKEFNIFRLWEQNMGTISSILAENIRALVEETSEEAVKKAIEKAVLMNKRSYRYVEVVARGIYSGDDYDGRPKPQDGDKKYGFFG